MNNYSKAVKSLLTTIRYTTKESVDARKRQLELKRPQTTDGLTTNALNIFGDLFDEESNLELPPLYIKKDRVTFATDTYFSEYGIRAEDEITPEQLEIIVSRAKKSKEIQKKRTKEKAEVFTPSWVCALQNNLIDEASDYIKTSFNVQEGKSWTPTDTPIVFSKKNDWKRYIIENRLEITCGEAPYLFSRYDTVTGESIPVRDSEGRFLRIGILDRKLRVVTENASNENWVLVAMAACATTFGYEYQGDNLVLARKNMIETFVDYYEDKFGEKPDEKLIEEVAEIASWNIWQMDGLKQVIPNSCSSACRSCLEKSKTGHDGKIGVFRFLTKDGFRFQTIEEML